MPELPEAEALRVFLDDHLVGRETDRVLPLAVSVLKTYDPPLTALRTTLRDAVARSGGLRAGELKAGKKSGMRVHGRTGEACPVCGDTIREVSFSDSSLQYCPTCQTGGKPPADRRLFRLLK
ncbi:zinc finger domain-containing protein [Streptomyces sp. NBC_01618]|uniref:zinc finger domain-containing protein n=1 Tax=Streptomyces sp. NBC_01618 TaxID=2975900 RepID=UPI00386BFE8A|nr:zf-TFIIB domain-containing protein [Streptomyces sp. NBC_01618]